MTRMRTLAIALLGASLGACGADGTTPAVDSGVDTGTTPIDSGNPGDGGGTMDVQTGSDAGDAGRADVRDSGSTDRPDAGPVCGTLPITPIARPTSGDTARVMGDTTAAFMAQNPGTRPGATSPVRPPTGNTTCVASRGQLVYSYTTGSAPTALRFSTTNAGTPRNFDTVLWVTTSCRATLTAAACNDDDPEFAAAADRRVSSTVTTEVLPANTTLFVVLGGFYPPSTGGVTTDRGPFELTIQELPPVAAGGACRVDGRSQRCDTSGAMPLDCVGTDPGAAMGTCRVRGSAAGARCRTSAPECDVSASLQCNADTGFCQTTVAAGMPCDAFNACAAGATCLLPTLGGIRGVCTAAGTALGAPCRAVGATGGRCDTGFVCNGDLDATITAPVCVRQAAAGGACVVNRVECVTGETCVTVHGGLIGTCTPNGTAAGTDCRTTGAACDAGLQCRAPGEGAATRCINVTTVGGVCDESHDCPDGSRCFLTDLSDRFVGRCGADGAVGGGCNTTTPNCMGTLTCSNPDAPENGLCQNVVAAGMPCNRPVDNCAEGNTCVLNEGSLTMGTCRAEGTVAGAECRGGDMPCGTGLTCSGTALSGGVCQTTAAAGGMCNPLTATTRCATGEVCGATAYNRGTCGAVTGMETEPNDSPAAVMASPVTATTTRRGALTFGDVDCVAVTVVANGSVTALVSDGNGRCPAPVPGGITLDLYSADGTWRGTSSNSALNRCAMIDGTRATVFPYAARLPAGTYTVCARGYRDPNTNVLTGPIADYVLSVSTAAP